MIKQRTDAVINITTGAGHGMTLEQRLEPARFFAPEVASLNMGSMNFGLFPMLNRYKDFKHDWEPKALENSRDFVFKNTFADIEYVLTTLTPLDVRFEFECYDIGHLYTLRHFLDRGLVKPPLFIQSVFGILGGIGTHPEDVTHMRRTADRLFGDQYRWSVLGAGRSQMRIAAMAAAMGGHVRVGLEDSLWKGQRPARHQSGTGSPGAPDRRGAWPDGGHAGRGARDPAAQGQAPGQHLGVDSREHRQIRSSPRARSGRPASSTLPTCATARRRRLPGLVFDYIDGGAEDEVTLARERAAPSKT